MTISFASVISTLYTHDRIAIGLSVLYRHLGCFRAGLATQKSEIGNIPTSRLGVDLHAKRMEKAGD
jgi:hypothetical protein